MLFNSFEYLVFLPLVFGAYWGLFRARPRARNLFILAASYIFYGWWDWRFLGLIALSTAVDYVVGRALARSRAQPARRALLASSLVVNLGLLGFFKYWNFFIASWVEAWAGLGVSMHATTLQVVLPVGISFYTFQTLSYTIDVYRRRVEPVRDPVAFAAYVAFFPQLVAGPIERASTLLPQFAQVRRFSAAEAGEGARQILWGLFKKVVVADQLAVHVDAIFAGYATAPTPVLVLGTVFFAFQIYCDFSGYSDIAIGTARLLGFRLMTNFRYPYFARDIAEFWRRWHISLSTWFRDYVYIPLGGSRGGALRTLRNVLAVFLLSGLWHGANWTFLAWGAVHAAMFLPYILTGHHRRFADERPAAAVPRELAGILVTFAGTCAAWVFFRAESLAHALGYFAAMARNGVGGAGLADMLPPLALVAALTAFEWNRRHREFALATPGWPRAVRYAVYFGLAWWIVIVSRKTNEFIYFQF